jgi:hypothetical protein
MSSDRNRPAGTSSGGMTCEYTSSDTLGRECPARSAGSRGVAKVIASLAKLEHGDDG